MIAGIGIDTISISRITSSMEREGFTEKVFSNAEIKYCNSNKQKEQHYAARFAAKEAFLKATGQGLAAGYDLKDIEIILDDSGKPIIHLYGSFDSLKRKNEWTAIHVSLSHDGDQAIAIVIIEK